MRVCLICEGCYPYVPGGVSGWIQMLCSAFEGIEFVVWSVATTREEMSAFSYKLPENVKAVHTLYLGDEQFQKGHKRILLSAAEKEVLKDLMIGSAERVDWVRTLELIKKYRRHMSDILMSESFFEICREEYQRQGSKKIFQQFLWNLRGIYFPLMYILSGEIPQADLYHAVSTGYAGIMGSCASYVGKKPFLLTEHGIYTREREEDIIRSQWVAGEFKEIWIEFFKKLSYIAYRQADVVTSLFETNKSLQLELGCPEEKIVVIPNGVEAQEYSVLERKREASDGVFLIGTVLRVVPIKDVKTMLLAFDIVKQAVPEAQLKIMGNDKENPAYYKECLELLEELGTQDVEFMGLVNVKEYLADMDLLLLSSISEGQPLAMLEGMAAGIPYVATNVGNCKAMLEGEAGDTLGPAGLVVPVMNSEAMADAIIRCIRDPKLRRRMGEAGRKRVEQSYSRKVMLERFHGLYESLGGGSKWQE